MFPVTRQVRRKRTRISGRRGSARRARARARGSAGESRRGELGSTRTQGGLGERRPGETEATWGDRVGLEERKGGLGGATRRTRGKKRACPGRANAPLAPGRLGRPSGPTVRSGRPCRRHRNARADPLGHRFMESAITRELRRARTSAPPRTPRRCWREYARAH
jgi:hypothetical protein